MAIPFPDISPVALSIGPLDIRWYALAYLAGFLLGWRYILSLAGKAPELRPNRLDIDDFVAWGILGVILGGRIGYVLFYQPQLYLQNPLELFMLWHGGMSFHGGASGMIVAMILYSYVKKIYVLRLTDWVCCAVPIGLFFGRIANFINGELFGRPTDVPWGMVFPHGGELARHPSQLYEAFLEGVVLFTVLFLLARMESIRARPGIISGVFLIGYALSRMFVEFFREPDVQIGYLFGFATMGQILSLPMIIGGLVCIFYALKHVQIRIPA
jgi:phosphatidylglycerol---prolipoprotein diacylglyceryl transferase